MAKVHQFLNPDVEVPPEFIPLIEKILRWFDNQIYPCFGTSFLGLTRSSKARSRAHSPLKAIGVAWQALDAATKTLWGTAADFIDLNGYQLFTSDYSYRKKKGLSLPGTPHAKHQMFGIRMSTLDVTDDARVRWFTPPAKAPIKVTFNAKLVVHDNPSSEKVYVSALGVVPKDGIRHFWHSQVWIGPESADWASYEVTYYGLKSLPDKLCLVAGFQFYMTNMKADLYIDDIVVTADGVEVYKEGFHLRSGEVWEWEPHQQIYYTEAPPDDFREGWEFRERGANPVYPPDPASIDVVYLG